MWLYTPRRSRSMVGRHSSHGCTGLHGVSRKLTRPVNISRRAGMQGSEPAKWLSNTVPRCASRSMLGVMANSLP